MYDVKSQVAPLQQDFQANREHTSASGALRAPRPRLPPASTTGAKTSQVWLMY